MLKQLNFYHPIDHLQLVFQAEFFGLVSLFRINHQHLR